METRTEPARQALIVAGMHRSGTSALARMLNLLGADLPGRLMPGTPGDNELGFWESIDIVETHDDLLAAAGLSWDSIGPLHVSWFQSEAATKMREQLLEVLVRDFSESRLFAIKDPRICRLVPLWLEILNRFGAEPLFVIAVRNPLEVAGSLEKRNGFAPEKSLLLWLWHMLEIERTTRQLPRTFVFYESLLRDWSAEARKIEKDLGIELPHMSKEAAAHVDAFLSDRYRNHHFRAEDLDTRNEIPRWVSRAYAALCYRREKPALFTRTMNRIRNELLAAHAAYGPVVVNREIELQNNRSQLERLSAKVAASDEALSELRGKTARMTGQLEARQAELDRLIATLETRDAKLAEVKSQAAKLTGQLEARQAQIERLTSTPNALDIRLEEAREASASQLEERQAQIERLAEALEDRSGELTRVSDEAAHVAGQLEERQGRVERLTEALDARASELADTHQRAARLEGQLEARQAQIERLTKAPHDLDSRLKEANDHAAQIAGQLTGQLKAQQAEIERMVAAFDDHDRRLTQANVHSGQLTGQLEARQAEIERMVAAFDEHDRRLTQANVHTGQLTGQLKARQAEIKRLAATLDERDASLTQASVRAAQLAGQLEERHADIERFSGEIALLGAVRIQQTDSIDRIITSRSWRMTRPLRFLASLLRRGFGVLKTPFEPSRAWERRLLEAGLFDPGHYQQQLLERGIAVDDPLKHYLDDAAARELSPHPLFDTSFYLQEHPEVAEQGLNPLLHFLETGHENSPHPLFDAAFYLEQITATGRKPETNLLTHYLEHGAAEGRNPHPLFDTVFYLQQHPEVAEQGLNPLLHFLETGHENSPHPLFDAAFYLEQLAATGRKPETNLLTHYLEHGAAEGLDPHPLFDTSHYLETNPRVQKTGENPLVHFLHTGAAEGCNPHPLFDTAYYAEEACPGVFEHGFNPLVHFAHFGAAEGRNPHPLFDTSFYLQEHPEVAEQGLNPLLHFLHDESAKELRAHPAYDLDFFFERSKQREWRHRTLEAQSLESVARAKGIAFEKRQSPLVSVVIAVHNQILFTLQCLHSLASDHADIDLEVIVVDDGSDDPTAEVLAAVPNLRLLRHDSAKGFIDAANSGAAAARGEYLLLLNNDTVVPPGSIDALLATFKEFPDAGAVGAKLLFGDGSLQEAGAIVWRDGSAWNFGRNQDPTEPQYNYARKVDYCSASCLMLPREFFERIGAFDRIFCPMYYEDTDLAFRVRQAGKEVYYQPAAEVFHFEGATSGTDTTSGMKAWQIKNQRTFVERWREELAKLPPNGDRPELSKDRAVVRRALVIDHRLPTPDQDSGSVRMFNLLKILRDRGFKVTFVPENLFEFQPYCSNLQKIGIEVLCRPHLTSIVEHLERTGESYDLVLLSRVAVAHGQIEAVKALCTKASVVFDTVDLHYLREQREAELANDTERLKKARLTKYLELSIEHQVDATIVVSPVEKELLLEEAPELQIHVVSNIHSVSDRVAPFENRRDFFFIGGFEHPPNIDAAEWLVADILPLVHRELPDVRLYIIGSKPPDQVLALASEKENVVVTGYVEDVVPYLDGCRLSVAPLTYGAGIKGKVNQSLAYGLPCVATSVAAEGMFLEDGVDILIADDVEDFARSTVRLYRDEILWRRLSRAGRKNIRKYFSFEAARRNIEELLQAGAKPSSLENQTRKAFPETG